MEIQVPPWQKRPRTWTYSPAPLIPGSLRSTTPPRWCIVSPQVFHQGRRAGCYTVHTQPPEESDRPPDTWRSHLNTFWDDTPASGGNLLSSTTAALTKKKLGSKAEGLCPLGQVRWSEVTPHWSLPPISNRRTVCLMGGSSTALSRSRMDEDGWCCVL